MLAAEELSKFAVTLIGIEVIPISVPVGMSIAVHLEVLSSVPEASVRPKKTTLVPAVLALVMETKAVAVHWNQPASLGGTILKERILTGVFIAVFVNVTLAASVPVYEAQSYRLRLATPGGFAVRPGTCTQLLLKTPEDENVDRQMVLSDALPVST